MGEFVEKVSRVQGAQTMDDLSELAVRDVGHLPPFGQFGCPKHGRVAHVCFIVYHEEALFTFCEKCVAAAAGTEQYDGLPNCKPSMIFKLARRRTNETN